MEKSLINIRERQYMDITSAREKVKMIEDLRMQINLEHMTRGVSFLDINTAYIDSDVEIGEGTLIGPNVTIQAGSKIGKGCTILQSTRISNTIIGDFVKIESSVLVDSEVGAETSVGPFAYLRPKSKVGKKCKVGDFVEVKNSNIGDGSKASHLTYIGDADVGKNVNLGCGVVFVNYDGTNKARSIVEDNAFVGCNVNLVSPVTVKSGAYVAAGSTITEDVSENSLAIARQRQANIEDWVSKRNNRSK